MWGIVYSVESVCGYCICIAMLNVRYDIGMKIYALPSFDLIRSLVNFQVQKKCTIFILISAQRTSLFKISY